MKLNQLLILIFTLATFSVQAQFIVNDLGDQGDATPGDGICETGTGNGICTLRAAIEEANTSSGTITFNIPGAGPWIINPLTNLPDLDGIVIDATTQPGWSDSNLILLQQAGTSTIGLYLDADDCEIYGMEITGFDGLNEAAFFVSSNVEEGNIGESGKGNVIH